MSERKAPVRRKVQMVFEDGRYASGVITTDDPARERFILTLYGLNGDGSVAVEKCACTELFDQETKRPLFPAEHEPNLAGSG